VSYIDSLIGEILQELEDQGLAEDTVVSFIGDHGFHLGEHSIVGKNTAFEIANNSPMIMRIPGVTDGGHVTDKLVEFVDLFPTLAELSGLPSLPNCPGNIDDSRKVNLCTEGSSLVPLFRDLNTSEWKDRVFYQYPHYTGSGQRFCMVYSMRTEQYRYTEWVKYDYSKRVPSNWDDLCAVELYDHHVDPLETKNIAEDAQMKGVRADLSKKIRAGWSAALPSSRGS
jgi:iduronate 2-sulfatase